VASSPALAPLDKGKRVLEVLSDDEDSDGGVVFKRRKAARVPILPVASPQRGDSFRDNPPSATSPQPTIVQEEKGEGAESAPPPPPAEASAIPASVSVAPDLIAIPPPIMHLMRGFNGGLMPEGSDRREGMPFYLGAFLVVALDWPTPSRRDSMRLWPRPPARTRGSTFLIAIPPTMSLTDVSCPSNWMTETPTFNRHFYFLCYIFPLAIL